MVMSFSRFFCLYWTRTGVLVFSSEHSVLGKYRAFETYPLSHCFCLLPFTGLCSTLMLRGQEVWLCSSSSTTLPTPSIAPRSDGRGDGGEATHPHLLPTHPRSVPRKRYNKMSSMGQKEMPLLSRLHCDFYVCPKADSTALKISCEVICLIVRLLLGFIINSEHVIPLCY